jgi:hypothetical protein
MTRKLLTALFFTSCLFFLLTAISFGMQPERPSIIERLQLKSTIAKELIGSDPYYAKVVNTGESNINNPKVFYSNTGTKGVVIPDTAIGIEIGSTTYDYAHNTRCTRMVEWRGDHVMHFAWMTKNDDVDGAGTYRMTTYQLFDPTFPGALGWNPIVNYGGKGIHVDNERSGYCGIEVLTTLDEGETVGRAMVYNHYDLTGGVSGDLVYVPTFWPDQGPGQGSFSAYKQAVPPELRQGEATEEFIWPYVSAQVYNGDTVWHTVCRRIDPSQPLTQVRYFRRTGSVDPDDPNETWSGFIVDTTANTSHCVEASKEGVAAGFEGKVAIAWCAHWPHVPGSSESSTPENLGLMVEQGANDVFCMISMDAGETWEEIGNVYAPLKHNCTQVDSTVGGYVPMGDVGALIDNTGTLHIVYAARPTGGLQSGRTGASPLDWEYPLFPIASRVLHWSDDYLNDPNETDFITIIKDYNYDFTQTGMDLDTICWGGDFHWMALNWPMMTQCDDKLYTIWGQYTFLEEGLWDDCNVRAFSQLDVIGSANCHLFFSVSTVANGGLNWDGYHRLSTYVGRCDTVGGSLSSGPYCHSHTYPSIPRFGMLVDDVDDDFSAAEIVQDGAWTYTSTGWYFDVQYIDDRDPGFAVRGTQGGWTRNPVRWFRVPCIEPDENPQLTVEPSGINLPRWYKPGGSGNDEIVTMINTGNATLTVSNITLAETEGPVSNWLAVDKTTATIVETIPVNSEALTVTINDNGIIDGGLAPALLRGTVTIHWDGGSTTDFNIECIIADTVQIVEYDTLFTPSISVAVSNAGRMGARILLDTIGYLGFDPALDCDNCYLGTNNNSGGYIGGASPFILHEQSTDTIISAYVAGHGWLSKHFVSDRRCGFRPQGGLIDLGTNGAFSSVSSNIFYSADSTVGLEVTYHAPQGGETAGPGSPPENVGNFINQEIKVFNISGAPLSGVYVGDIVDFEIPSDSSANILFGTSNFSDYDEDLNVMYAYGWETALPDTFCDGEATGYPNDCGDASRRYGGSIFLGGFNYDGDLDVLTYQPDPRGVFSEKYQQIFPRGQGHLNYDSLLHYYNFDAGWSGYERYTSADPDSAAMDLIVMTLYGQYDIGVTDTLYVHKQVLVEYQVETAKNADFLVSVANAKDYSLSKSGHCCRAWGVVGDADVNGVFDILDLIWMIDNKFKGGSGVLWPDPANGYECTSIMDFDANGIYDILDIIWGIDFKFKESGLPPVCPN